MIRAEYIVNIACNRLYQFSGFRCSLSPPAHGELISSEYPWISQASEVVGMRRNPSSLLHLIDFGPTSFCRADLARAHTHTHMDACEVVAVNRIVSVWG